MVLSETALNRAKLDDSVTSTYGLDDLPTAHPTHLLLIFLDQWGVDLHLVRITRIHRGRGPVVFPLPPVRHSIESSLIGAISFSFLRRKDYIS